MEHLAASVTVADDPDRVWQRFGSFQGVGRWHPWLKSVTGDGETPGSVRTASAAEGSRQVERLEAVDPVEHFYRYRMVSTPMPVVDYLGEFRVRPSGSGASRIEWSATFGVTSPSADPQAMVGEFLRAGLRAIEDSYK